MRKQFFGLVVIALLVAASVVHAQPSLKMMIPANPGWWLGPDRSQLAAAMQSAKLVSSVQFDNKGGAGGTIGLAQFINSAKGDPNADHDRRHGDGRRDLPREFAGQSHHGDAARASYRRI